MEKIDPVKNPDFFECKVETYVKDDGAMIHVKTITRIVKPRPVDWYPCG